MALQNITISGSIKSYPSLSYGQRIPISSTDYESFPIETITGSQAGAWPVFVNGTNYTTNLQVNVTQSWSGSNITPLGAISFIHNTNEEFFNGEFSGSVAKTVGDSLNDPDCSQYLNVSTTAPEYYVTPFQTTYVNGILSLDTLFNFLANFNVPAAGEMYFHYTAYVTTPPGNLTITADWVKISKYDANGNDITPSLQSLTKIIYNDTGGAGIITFDIITAAEYPTYYLYKVISNTFSSYPVGNHSILNYTLLESQAGTITVGPLASRIINSTWTETFDSANAFNTSTGIYSPRYTQTSYINATISGVFTAFPGITHSIAFGLYDVTNPGTYNLINVNYTPLGGPVRISGSSQTVTFSNVILPPATLNANNKYALCVIDYSGIHFDCSGFSIYFTNTATPFSATTQPVILEPYVNTAFPYSDCDVLMNTTNKNDISTSVQKVLYTGPGGSAIPSNIRQLVSGTAEPAEVNDYLFSANANVLPRYAGVRSESPDFNLNTTFGGYGSLPNVEKLQTYFASFDFFRSTTGELLDKTAAHITYLIDKDGTVFTPALSSSYYWNLIDNFETDKKANIIIYNENGDKITLGNKTIIRPGVLPRAILESQIASDPKVINNISFGTTSDNTSGEGYDFSFIARYGVNNASRTVISYPAEAPTDGVIPLKLAVSEKDSISLISGDDSIKFNKGSSDYLLQFKLTVIAVLTCATTPVVSGTFQASASFQYSDDEGTSWANFYETVTTFSNSVNNPAYPCLQEILTPSFYPVQDRKYRVVLSHNISSYNQSSGITDVFRIEVYNDRSAFPGKYTQLEVLQLVGGTGVGVFDYRSKYVVSSQFPNAVATIPANSSITFPIYDAVLSTPNIDVTNSTTNVPTPPIGFSNIQILTTSNRTFLKFTLNTITNAFVNSNIVNQPPVQINFEFQKSTDGGVTYNTISSIFPYNVGNPGSSGWLGNSWSIPLTEAPVAGNLYRFILNNTSNYAVKLRADSSVQVNQTFTATPPVTSLSSASIYWTTGSSGDRVLTSSYFYPYWTAPDSFYTQNSISNMYGPNLPFIINPYTDVIRFEGNENQVYTIVDAHVEDNFIPGPPSTGSLIITLDRGISPGTDINSFLIRRFYPNPNYVVMDSPIISGSGYLIPEYVSNDIRQNFDNIIVKLKESGLF